MADVEISYNNSVIASLSDSGTEVLETKGKFMSDDITVTYTSPVGGGGSSSTDVTLYINSTCTLYYVDGDGVYHGGVAGSSTTQLTVLSKSIIMFRTAAPEDPLSPFTYVNATKKTKLDAGSRATGFRFVYTLQAD